MATNARKLADSASLVTVPFGDYSNFKVFIDSRKMKTIFWNNRKGTTQWLVAIEPHHVNPQTVMLSLGADIVIEDVPARVRDIQDDAWTEGLASIVVPG